MSSWYHFWAQIKWGIKEKLRPDLAQANTELVAAVLSGNIERAEAAIQNGADVNYAPKGLSFLHIATSFNRADMVRVLLEHGANPNISDIYGAGDTPLRRSKQKKDGIITLMLLKAGATDD